jgi:hypothetical protein
MKLLTEHFSFYVPTKKRWFDRNHNQRSPTLLQPNMRIPVDQSSHNANNGDGPRLPLTQMVLLVDFIALSTTPPAATMHAHLA